jgi:hypothetical protein
MRSLAASLVVLLALCGSARAVTEVEPNSEFNLRQEIAFTDDEVDVEGEIAPFADPADPADYFAFTGMDSDAVYWATLDATNLAILHLNETGAVLAYDGDTGVPGPELNDLTPNDAGELFLAVCSLGQGEPGQRPYDCEVGTTTAFYALGLMYIPEPGADALRLAALLGLAAMSRRRA